MPKALFAFAFSVIIAAIESTRGHAGPDKIAIELVAAQLVRRRDRMERARRLQ